MSAVFSCLRLFVLLLALFDNVVNATFSFRPPNSTCVWTERQLRKVIEKASKETRTRITLCRQNISISSIRNPDYSTGIDLTDRIVDLRCYLKRSKGMCTLDAEGSSRIFVGDRADLTVRNVLFANGKPDECGYGGAIYLENSTVSMTGCSFINNGKCCDGGGAIYVFKSKLAIKGGSKKMPVLFSDNEGEYGGALYLYASELSIDDYTIFSFNTGFFVGAVYLDNSSFNIKNVKFQENVGMTAALFAENSDSKMENVEFIGNQGETYQDYVIDITESSLQATNCTFANHNNTVLVASNSKITLKDSTFSNNTSNDDGSDIFIFDDVDPLKGGTFVKCESNVVFCNGLDKRSIYESRSLGSKVDKFSNTDCDKKGLQGTPGQGSCPI